jgi:hypothetical protein
VLNNELLFISKGYSINIKANLFITLVFQKSNLSITIAVLILASLDAILQSIILNGYLANLVVFNLEDKFEEDPLILIASG